MKIRKPEDLESIKEKGNKRLFSNKTRINVGTASCCVAKGAERTLQAIEHGLKERNIDAEVYRVGCSGLCHSEPTVEVQPPGKPKVIYGNITEDNVARLLDAVATDGTVADLAIARVDSEEHTLVGNIAYAYKEHTGDSSDIASLSDIESLSRQHRVILRNAGAIDPESIEEYIARGGYAGLAKALSMDPDAVIGEITDAGLRGRGGGGFPAGIKWNMCRQAKGKEKYLVCNVSEGEPGIGMHRSFLESDPHSVLEGLIIGAHAIGAQTAYVYIRDNYRIALGRFQKAIADAEEAGLLGKNILGSSLNLSVVIKEGGGRFVCGEETALIACLEGRIGEPRQRPPFPTDKGLYGKPTCINNVETWANVPVIIMKGSAWYQSIGSADSKGTKVISLAGNVARPGMIEVEMGTSLDDVVNVFGGGMAGGKSLKGIQTGGPSGGVLPASMSNLGVDYDELKNAGSMLGSGGMVIMDADTDMVKIARYFTDFFVAESCGKCAPCREGVCRICDILDEILSGRAQKDCLSLLRDMSDPIMKTSACALGKTAPTPVLTTLHHFPEDYQKYIQ